MTHDKLLIARGQRAFRVSAFFSPPLQVGLLDFRQVSPPPRPPVLLACYASSGHGSSPGTGFSGPRYFYGPSTGHGVAGFSGPRYFHGPSTGHGSAPGTGFSGPRYFHGPSTGHCSAPVTGFSGPHYFYGPSICPGQTSQDLATSVGWGSLEANFFVDDGLNVISAQCSEWQRGENFKQARTNGRSNHATLKGSQLS